MNNDLHIFVATTKFMLHNNLLFPHWLWDSMGSRPSGPWIRRPILRHFSCVSRGNLLPLSDRAFYCPMTRFIANYTLVCVWALPPPASHFSLKKPTWFRAGLSLLTASLVYLFLLRLGFFYSQIAVELGSWVSISQTIQLQVIVS